METDAGLNRALEFLPSDDELLERSSQGLALTRPELAVLLSYAKIFIKSKLVSSELHQDSYISQVVFGAFPDELVSRYPEALINHRLCREIIASQLANGMVDDMGITFVVHLLEFVGGSVADVAMAYVAFARSFGLSQWIEDIASQPQVDESLKLEMLLELIRLGRRCTRWILRHRRQFGTVEDFVASYQPRIDALISERITLSRTMRNDNWQLEHEELMSAGFSEALALRSAGAAGMVVALPIINVADNTGKDPLEVARVFIGISNALGIDWLSEQLGALPSLSHWQAMERDSLSDEVVTHQATLVGRCFMEADGDVESWLAEQQGLIGEWRRVLEELQHSTVHEFSMFSMACRKLNNLCRSG
jgi:glutamate dehydrogenase